MKSFKKKKLRHKKFIFYSKVFFFCEGGATTNIRVGTKNSSMLRKKTFLKKNTFHKLSHSAFS